MLTLLAKLNPFGYSKETLDASAASLEKYELMKDADFLAKLTNKQLKKFFLAQASESNKLMSRLDLISKEIQKRGLV